MKRHYVKKSELRRWGRPISFGLYDCEWGRYGLGYKKKNPFKCVPDCTSRWRQIVKAYKLMGIKWRDWDKDVFTINLDVESPL